MSFKKHDHLDARLIQHLTVYQPVSAMRLAQVAGCSAGTACLHLHALQKQGVVHVTGVSPTNQRWHLGPKADEAGAVHAPEGWSTPRSAKAGHRIKRATTEEPSGESWWTTVERDRFTAEALKRTPLMKPITWGGASVDTVRDTWEARPKRRSAEA